MATVLMNLEAEKHADTSQSARLERFRQRLASWATFALLLVFFIVTIALWGWAAWWAVSKLIGLVF